tara:strand:- start:332 stop:748 length:417 start_codon:yes stop_codon:yes gene_type:complete
MIRNVKDHGKKGKQRVSTSKVDYIATIILIVILMGLLEKNNNKNYDNKNSVIDLSSSSYSGNETSIGKIYVSDVWGDHYLKIEINNPINKKKTCNLNMTVADKLYKSNINIEPESNKTYSILMDMLDGRMNMKIDINC